MRVRKTWEQKMDNPKMPPKMQKRCGTGALLLPSPREVDALIRSAREGSLKQFREFARNWH